MVWVDICRLLLLLLLSLRLSLGMWVLLARFINIWNQFFRVGRLSFPQRVYVNTNWNVLPYASLVPIVVIVTYARALAGF